MLKRLAALALTTAALAVQPIAALACGGLVAPNGAIRLTRATTLVDWHDGIEHYLTRFTYQASAASDFGWTVPLPPLPAKVEQAGAGTLPRLNPRPHPHPSFMPGPRAPSHASA